MCILEKDKILEISPYQEAKNAQTSCFLLQRWEVHGFISFPMLRLPTACSLFSLFPLQQFPTVWLLCTEVQLYLTPYRFQCSLPFELWPFLQTIHLHFQGRYVFTKASVSRSQVNQAVSCFFGQNSPQSCSPERKSNEPVLRCYYSHFLLSRYQLEVV